MSPRKLFYLIETNRISNISATRKTPATATIWRPSLTSLKPSGFAFFPFFIWWVFHYLHVFSNRDYHLLASYDNGCIIHRSCVFPKYFRFSFMKKRDLQIGDIWTDVRFRGKGLATQFLSIILNMQTKSARRLWYIVDEDNLPSIRVAEKVGFQLIGVGFRKKRFGVRLLGSFCIEKFVEERFSSDHTSPG